MPIRVTPTTYGAAAFDALAAAVGAAKDGDPLAPVAVIVPTNTAGVMARRALGWRGGAAAVDVLTLYRLAELVGAATLLDEGRQPVSTAVVDLAVKHVIHDAPGTYHAVNHHPSTIVALRDLYREVRVAGPTALDQLTRTPRGREPARVCGAVERLLGPTWYDEGDLLSRAIDRLRHAPPARLARAVVFLPRRLRALDVELLRALAENGAVDLVVGVTGEADADVSVARLVESLTGAPLPPTPTASARGAIELVSTTDADDEVRVGVRAVLDAARHGARFDRIAVLFPTTKPYARLVEHQLTSAGIPWNGRPGTAVVERMVPRVLAELLELDRRGLRRAALMTLLADVPARMPDGRPVPTARWERIARRAGIVNEHDWDRNLPRFIDGARDPESRDARDADAAEDMRRFVEDLRARLGHGDARRPWAEWAAWAKAQLELWFDGRWLDQLEGAEREAWEQTQRVLDRLHHLDAIGEPITRAEFRATYLAELDIAPGRHGKVGDGVHVSPLAAAGGLDVDAVVILGGADGMLPPPPWIDPLLTDGDRAAAGLATTDERVGDTHHQFVAAALTTPTVVVTVPRGDLRAATVNHPSRWIVPLSRGRPFSLRTIDSHAHGVASSEFPVSAAEHRLRALWTRRCGLATICGDVPAAGADPVLVRAVRLRDARASDAFTEYDGNLSSLTVAPLAQAVSPSRIELWARCPFAYFVQYVLGVSPIDEPDTIETLSALDRGSAIHGTIDRLQRAVLDGTIDPPGFDGWGAEHAALLERIACQMADELHATGRTGRRAFWVNERAAVLSDLAAWIEFDGEGWAGRRIQSSEQRFGLDPPVEIELASGRTIAFAGQIDRIDELPDGTLVVTDHKTGKSGDFEKLSAEDPTLGATRFQLPVYAAAARALQRRPDAPVHAEYAFFKPAFKRRGITFDDTVWKQVGRDLQHVVDGIESGTYPPAPAPPTYQHRVGCWYCEPDGLGTALIWSEWDRKRHDPRLQRWFGEP